MRRCTHIAILILIPTLAFSQVFSSKGRFSIEFDRGCSPMTANITEHDSFGDVTRQYYYFDGAGITNSKTFTYQEAGTYEIVQIVGVDGIPDKTDTLVLEVVESIKPKVNITKCSNQEISVTSLDSFYDSIRVYFTTVDSVTLQQNEAAEFAYTSSELTAIGFKGFFDNADQVCDSYFEELVPVTTLQAPQLISASIKETCKDLFSLYVTLQEVDTLTSYQIIINQSSQSILYDGFLNQNTITLNDIPFEEADYCIYVQAYDPCNDLTERSREICGTPSELSLSPFESLYSTYESGGIFINLDVVNVGSFDIYRKIKDQEFEFRSQQTSSFTDPIGSFGRQYFYKIDYVDSCGQILFTAQTNPPLIESDKIEANQYNIRFTPPDNSLTQNGIDEYLTGTSLSQSSGEITTENFNVSLNAKDGSPRQFISATTSYSDGLVLKSNTEAVRYELVIYVPTAFTPNGDGLNDTMEFFGLPTENASLKIYSRWGQLVYASDDESTPKWDGTINGSLANEGTYLYEIIFETVSGEKRMQKGTFALIKK